MASHYINPRPCVLKVPVPCSETSSSRIANVVYMAITIDSTIADLLREKPESAAILQSFGMGCLG
ncbi:MAG TPA: DUF1858 domain-containing protein, partial [Methanocorpusculum sp.]|nr:DUF1858 domain-containing protein [Methanocorpusculum sp.]